MPLFKTLTEKLPVKDFIMPLKHAARNGNLEVFNLIMEKFVNKSDIIINSNKSWTILHYAAEGGNLEIFQTFLKYTTLKNPMDFNGNPMDFNGVTPLHVTAQNGHDSVHRFIMIHVGDNKNPEILPTSMTPIHLAAREGHLNICLTIMEHIEYKNLRFIYGQTPLHEAALNGHLDICQLILEQSEETNPVNDQGFTPLLYAYKESHQEVCELIIGKLRETNPEVYSNNPNRTLKRELMEAIGRVRDHPFKTSANFTQFLPLPSSCSCQQFFTNIRG